MLEMEALHDMRVVFATPMNRGADPVYVGSMWGLSGDCAKAGLENCLKIHPDADPIRGRNAILRQFLEEEKWTHLFWIDSDVMFNSDQAFRLLLADKDVAVGTPPIKELPIRYPFFPIDDHADDDGFCRVFSAVTGFMCIRRTVFPKLMEKYPEYRLPDGSWRFFDNMIDPQHKGYLTEDYAFCRLWHDTGGEIHADVYSKLGHDGHHLFRGDLGKFLGLDG